jgi:hypothetical protein
VQTSPSPRSLRISLIAVAATASLAACGGSSSTTKGAESAQAVKVPALPKLPDDPLRLLPSQPHAVFSADIAALRESPLFARAKRFAEQHGCIDDEHARWLTERTQRLVAARYVQSSPTDPTAPAAGPRAVTVLRGQYTAGDAREALTQTLGLTGTATEPISEQARGRFIVLQAAGMSAVQLDEHLLAIGTQSEVGAVLAIADGEAQNWLADPAFMRTVDAPQWLGAHPAALLMRVDDDVERRLSRSLSSLGAGEVTQGLSGSTAALALTLDGGAARGELHVLYPSAEPAGHAAAQLRSLIDQARMLLRFTGLSLGVEGAQVTTEDAQLSVALELAPQELNDLAGQLESMLGERATVCAPHRADET